MKNKIFDFVIPGHVVKQDKVNHAVSEREDRVTDLTTLTKDDVLYWAATGLQMGCIEL